jgi:phage gpG-like protein
MEEIRELMYKSVRENFLAGGRPAWPARLKSYPWPILRKSAGGMFDQIQRDSASNYAEVWMPDSVRYAKYHQDGTRKMQRRSFMMFQDEDYDDILKIFADSLFTTVSLTGPTSSIGDSK